MRHYPFVRANLIEEIQRHSAQKCQPELILDIRYMEKWKMFLQDKRDMRAKEWRFVRNRLNSFSVSDRKTFLRYWNNNCSLPATPNNLSLAMSDFFS